MIRVIYKDGKEDLVTQKFLDILLHVGEVQMFQRESDWAIIGVDPLRANNPANSLENERRKHQHTLLPRTHVQQAFQACC